MTLVHVGYPKTSTSWMQKYMFNCEYTQFTQAIPRNDLMPLFVWPHVFEFNVLQTKQRVENSIEAATAQGFFPVLSQERLVGGMHSGGYDVVIIANRLHDTIQNPKILLVIREQKSAIRSTYVQYVQDGGTIPIHYYLNPPINKDRIPLFDINFFNYNETIKLYYSLFGENNVLVLPYEMFMNDMGQLITALRDFLDQEIEVKRKLPLTERVRQSQQPLTLELLRRFNLIFGKRDQTNPHPLFPSALWHRRLSQWGKRAASRLPKINERITTRYMAQVESRIGSYYRASNRETNHLIIQDLSTLGYDL
jgi:hypothetical protein